MQKMKVRIEDSEEQQRRAKAAGWAEGYVDGLQRKFNAQKDRREMIGPRGSNVWDFLKASVWGLAVVFVVVLAGLSLVAVSLAGNPITFAADGAVECGSAVDGNLQFDGREVNVQDLGKAERTFNGSPRKWYYPLTDGVPARWINVPDFEQAKLNHVDANCRLEGMVEGSVPALLLVSAIHLDPTVLRRTIEKP